MELLAVPTNGTKLNLVSSVFFLRPPKLLTPAHPLGLGLDTTYWKIFPDSLDWFRGFLSPPLQHLS